MKPIRQGARLSQPLKELSKSPRSKKLAKKHNVKRMRKENVNSARSSTSNDNSN